MSLAAETTLHHVEEGLYDERIAEDVLYALWGVRRGVSSPRPSPVSQHVTAVGWLYAVPIS